MHVHISTCVVIVDLAKTAPHYGQFLAPPLRAAAAPPPPRAGVGRDAREAEGDGIALALMVAMAWRH